ncbi:MAG TPA: hypothetical protein VH480_04540 [Streptosporangiaceae bacterium]|jgi:hypothetical protein
MHPYTMSQLAHQHTSELRAAAGRTRPHVTPPGPRNTVRYRAGWTLVEIGLRLAGVPDDV